MWSWTSTSTFLSILITDLNKSLWYRFSRHITETPSQNHMIITDATLWRNYGLWVGSVAQGLRYTSLSADLLWQTVTNNTPVCEPTTWVLKTLYCFLRIFIFYIFYIYFIIIIKIIYLDKHGIKGQSLKHFMNVVKLFMNCQLKIDILSYFPATYVPNNESVNLKHMLNINILSTKPKLTGCSS